MNPIVADVLFLSTAVCYLVAFGFFVAYLVGRARSPAFVRLGPRILGVGAALHASHIVIASLLLNVCPVTGIHFAISVISMLACLGFLSIRRRFHIDALGAFVTPFALTSLLASHFVGISGGMVDPSPRVRSAFLPVHVTMNLLGVALFSLACAAAIGYLVQEKLLKQKRVEGVFQRLPPLDDLDSAEHRFLLAGFPLLTIGVLTGTLWAGRVASGDHAAMARTALGYLMWVMFAAVLLLRAAAGWRGRRAAYGTIAAFGVVVLMLLFYLLRGASPATTMAVMGS